MKICPRCGYYAADDAGSCPACAIAFAPPAPPAKGKAIVGMILSINGLVGAAIGLSAIAFFALVLLWATVIMLSDGYYDPDLISMQDMLRGYFLLLSLVLGAEFLPCSIVGRFIGNKAHEDGNQTAMAKSAVRLGKIGVILSVVMIGLGLLCTVFLYAI